MRLLLVEDKDSFRRLLVQALAGTSWEVTAVGDPREALAALGCHGFDVLVTDLRLPGMSGLELLRAAKRLDPTLRAVLMSAFGEPRDIVAAIRLGAEDFLPKPFDLDQFLEVLERLRALRAAPPPDPREPWIDHSPAMRALGLGLAKAADTDLAVLFHGERGSGRERAARRLHALRHPQAPYLSVAAGSLGEAGPGAELLTLVQGGSLYLSGLDRVLPAGLRTAMDSDLGRRVHWMAGCREPGAIPEALRLRLGVLDFRLAPLRERREDIVPLFWSFLEALARQDGSRVPEVARGVEKDLLERPWPGNLRQMAWAVAQAWRATAGPVLAPLAPEGLESRPSLLLPWPQAASLEAMLAEVAGAAGAALVRSALEGRRRDPAGVAQELGLSLRGLARVLRENHISLEDE
jgi:DNA-binding NtrC family response regulator